MRLAHRLATLAVVAGLALPLPGCDEGTAPPLAIDVPQPQRVLYVTTSLQGFQTDVWIAIPVLLSDRGKLDVTVDWTSDDTWMYVFFGETECDYTQLAGGTCPFTIASETKDPKPRVFFTDFVDPGTYYVVLYNVPRDNKRGIGSDNTEAVSLQVGLTIFPFDTQSTEARPVRLGRPFVLSPPHL